MTPREDIDTPTLLASQFPEFAQNPLHPSGRGGVQRLLALQASAAWFDPDRLCPLLNDGPESGLGLVELRFGALSKNGFAVPDFKAPRAILAVPTVSNRHDRRIRVMYVGGFHVDEALMGVSPSALQWVSPNSGQRIAFKVGDGPYVRAPTL